jgi:hypothetical protein
MAGAAKLLYIYTALYYTKKIDHIRSPIGGDFSGPEISYSFDASA